MYKFIHIPCEGSNIIGPDAVQLKVFAFKYKLFVSHILTEYPLFFMHCIYKSLVFLLIDEYLRLCYSGRKSNFYTYVERHVFIPFTYMYILTFSLVFD